MELTHFSGFVAKSVQLLLSFSIIVIIHEFGHFITAKWVGCRVEKFYLFFNPWFSLFKRKYKGTEYGVGWIPFGGFVKIAGMIDESMDVKTMKSAPKPWEFRSKKPWQKIIVMAAGVIFNLILAFVIYVGISYAYGEEYIDNKDLTYGLHFSDLGHSLGLEEGDIVTRVGDEPIHNYRMILRTILLKEARSIEVSRGGQFLTLPIPDGFIHKMTENSGKEAIDFVRPRFLAQIEQVTSQAQIMEGTLQKGDRIIKVDNEQHVFASDLANALKGKQDVIINLGILRANDTLTTRVKLNPEGKIGIIFTMEQLHFTQTKFGFFTSIYKGAELAVHSIVDYYHQLRLLFTSKEVKVSESLGSVISIWKIFPEEITGRGFWMLTAFLSIIIGLMNLLPIPALDGGHIVFAIYEWVVGKPAPQKALELAQVVGMVLLMGLMVYALGLDISRIFR